jgi:uroporphyrinogen decarboxylase
VLTVPPADAPFLAACRRQPVPHTPVWFMRQAGRSLPEYRALRADLPLLTACTRPDVVVEATMQPVRRYGVDAAILFSDIVLPLSLAGVDVEIRPDVGPVVGQPVRDRAAVGSLPELDPVTLRPVVEAVGALREQLAGTPLIGFAGAPFTLASYLIEGGPSRTFDRTRALMYGDPPTWHDLLGRLATIAATFLRAQVDAGVQAVQLFDSWVGVLAPADYRQAVAPHTAQTLAAVPDVPRIHFGVGTGELLAELAAVGADVVGVDWRVSLDDAIGRLGTGCAVQGNLDPAALLAPWPVVEQRAREVLAAGRGAGGHVFNLGHGVLPQTDPAILERLVGFVHEESRR